MIIVMVRTGGPGPCTPNKYRCSGMLFNWRDPYEDISVPVGLPINIGLGGTRPNVTG